MSRTRMAMLGMVVVGGLAAAGGGTFAAFSASTTNASSTFATGTLVLSNQKNAASACLSSTGGVDTNANAGCDQLFALSVRKPGEGDTVDLTLKNEGSIDATALQGFVNGACSASNAAGQAFNGGGDPCGAIAIYVQEFSDSGRSTPSVCHYGGGSATTCGYDAAETLATFGSTYADAGTALGMGALNGGASRYFTIGLQMNSSAGNDMQGRAATFGFTWQLTQ